MRSSPLSFTGRIKSLHGSRRTALAKDWADSLWRLQPHCRSYFTRVSLVGEPLESAIHYARNLLFCSHWHLRGGGHDCVFSSVSERRPAFFCPRNFGWRRGNNGYCRYFVFSRIAFLAATARCRARDCGTLFATQVTLRADFEQSNYEFHFVRSCNPR